MLCKMAFQLFCKGVALHLDNSTAKAFLCNQGGTLSLSITDGLANMVPAWDGEIYLKYLQLQMTVTLVTWMEQND